MKLWRGMSDMSICNCLSPLIQTLCLCLKESALSGKVVNADTLNNRDPFRKRECNHFEVSYHCILRGGGGYGIILQLTYASQVTSRVTNADNLTCQSRH